MRNLIIMLSCVCVLLAGCSQSEKTDPKPELKLTADHPAVTVDENGLGLTIAVDKEETSVTIGITSNVDNWTVSENIPDWIETTPSGKSVVVKIKENKETESRNDQFKISVRNESGTVDATVRISQAGQDGQAGKKPELRLTANHPDATVDSDGLGVTIAVDKEEASVAIGIITDAEKWTISDDIPNWIQTIPYEESVVVNITENKELDGRNYQFKISVRNENGTVDATVRITQAGLEPATLEISDDKLEIRPSGGSVKLGITTNQTTVSVHKTEAWLSYSQDSDEVIFTAEANETGVIRSAEVSITAGGGDNASTKKVVVSQDASNGGNPGPSDDFVGKWNVTGKYYNVNQGGLHDYVHEMYATKVDENTVSFYPIFGNEKLFETIGRDPWHFGDDGETLLVTVNDNGTISIPFQELTPTWPLYAGMFPNQGMYFAPLISDDPKNSWENSFENIPVNNYTVDLSNDFIPKDNDNKSLAPHRGSYWVILNGKGYGYFYLEGMFLDIVWTKSTEN